MDDARPEGFLSRWSRRKALARSAQPLPPEPAALGPAAAVAAPASPADRSGARAEAPAPDPVSAAAAPAPTLDEVAQLTPSSDFSAYTRPGLAAEVRNAAMRKLFADPHFNRMDGLDVYIDDYGRPDPLSPAMLRQMASAAFLNLVDDAPGGSATPASQAPEDARVATPDAAAPTDSTEAPAGHSPDHDHPDLRLQPDLAAGRERAGPAAA